MRSHLVGLGHDTLGLGGWLTSLRSDIVLLLRTFHSQSRFFHFLVLRNVAASHQGLPPLPGPDFLIRIPRGVLTFLELSHQLRTSTQHSIHSYRLRLGSNG